MRQRAPGRAACSAALNLSSGRGSAWRVKASEAQIDERFEPRELTDARLKRQEGTGTWEEASGGSTVIGEASAPLERFACCQPSASRPIDRLNRLSFQPDRPA